MGDKMRIAAAGATLGFLGAVGIYFAPEEPYPGYITAAGTLAGITIALLVTTGVTSTTTVFRSICWGAVSGLLASTAVFLAKGGWTSWDAPVVVPTGVVTGVILGPIVRWLSRSAT